MQSRNKEDLDRLRTETRALTCASIASCKDTATHIEQSRLAVARSLRLLTRRFSTLRE